MHLMPDIEFRYLKERWDRLVDTESVEKVIDPLIIEAVTNINKDPGLITIYSCQGHPEQVGSRWSTGGYVMIGVKDVEAVHRLYRQMVVRLPDPSRIDLKMSDRYNIVTMQGFYPVWILGWDVTVDTVELMASALNEASASYNY